MLTGHVPFEGDHPAQILLSVRAGEPPSLASRGIDDPELWAILKRGLARRNARWASVRELGAALARELWKRGVTQDISGVSLWPSWVDGSDDLRRTTDAPPPGPAEHPHGRTSTGISAQAASAVVPADASSGAGPARRAPLAETIDAERPASLRVSIKRPALTSRPFTPPASMAPASSPPPPTPPTAAPRRGRSPATWLSAGALVLAALVATFVLGRRSERSEAPTGAPLASTTAPPPTLVVEAAPPSTSAREGTSPAAASAQTAQANPFTMGETPKPPPQASPPNPRERAVVTPPPPVVTPPPPVKPSRGADEDLKNPFH